jgi:hypothetical protein
MLNPKRNIHSLFPKTQNPKSIKDLSNDSYRKFITRQLMQKYSSLTSKSQSKTPTPSPSPNIQSLTSSKPKSTRHFIHYPDNTKTNVIRPLIIAKSTNNSKHNVLNYNNVSNSNETNEINSINEYNDIKSKQNKTVDYDSYRNTNVKQSRPFSANRFNTPNVREMKSKSKKDLFEFGNGLQSPTSLSVKSHNNNKKIKDKANSFLMIKNHKPKKQNGRSNSSNNYNNNNNNIITPGKNFQTITVEARNPSSRCFVISGPNKKPKHKKNVSYNNINQNTLIPDGMDYEKYCKVLNNRITVLRFQVERNRAEKIKLEETLKGNDECDDVIKKLESEIQSFKNLAANCKRNCQELTKEIFLLQNEIKKYK